MRREPQAGPSPESRTGSRIGGSTDDTLASASIARLLPRRRRKRWLVSLAAASALVGVGVLWTRDQPSRPSFIDGVAIEPQPWMTALVVIPNEPPPPPPINKLEARLAALARRVEVVSAGIDPPLVAFGAEALRADLEHAIARLDKRAQVSVHVRDLESGHVLFDYFGDTLLNPASNHKLLTSSAALELLGSGYVFETRVLLVGESLILVGEGDPTLDGDALQVLATEVAERVPVATITDIVVDDSAFSPRMFGPGYSEQGWGPSYEAPSGALSLNFNTVEITIYPVGRKLAVKLEPDSTHVIVDNRARLAAGPSTLEIRSEAMGVTRESVLTKIEITGTLARGSHGYQVRRRVADPGMFTGGVFASMLAEASQSERLPVRTGTAPLVDLDGLDEHGDGEALAFPIVLEHVEHVEHLDDVLLVAHRRSPPLLDVVSGGLAYSNNFTAEQILRTLGWRMTGDPGDWDNGSEVVRGYWVALGNDPDALIFENGSGLSVLGRVTTSGLVDLMAVAGRTQSAGATLLDALPVAGEAGTLRTRLRRSGKRVRAKTGTLNGVSGLTGVITTEAGVPQVAFSILINVHEIGSVRADTRSEIADHIVMDVLEHIDGWAATRGTLILDLEPMPVTPN
jgi:D-alanyl-D-alanine carboxypeptidase/D-alanyl-D-alanine-endopeptidase (penicillin-binding protein 4)